MSQVFAKIKTFWRTGVLHKTVLDKLMVLFAKFTVAAFGRKIMLKGSMNAGSFERFKIES